MDKLYRNTHIELFKKFSPASIREFSVLNRKLYKLVKELYPEIYNEKFYILILKSDDKKLCEKYWHIFDIKNICSESAKYGALNCLKYAKENNCPWDKYTCSNAASNGHLECLIYAKENNCPWDTFTCSSAAENGHLNCLTYAKENNCPWDEYTCSFATLYGHLDCLKYAKENNLSLIHI